MTLSPMRISIGGVRRLAIETETWFAKLQFWSLRGTKCRGNLMNYQYVTRLLRFARNDNMGIMQSSQTEALVARKEI